MDVAAPIQIRSVYRDAWQIYRLLMRRSVTAAAIVFAFVLLLDGAADAASSAAASILLGLASLVADFAGPVVVQGALIEIVRNIHEGRRPERLGNLFGRARQRFWTLLGASLVYGLGVILGLLLLIVPGLLAAARWCLMAPLIMFQGVSVDRARERSSDLVLGQTAAVLLVVGVTFLALNIPPAAAAFALHYHWIVRYPGSFIWSSLTAPFEAHVLTVLYYRLTDPERPVIHEQVARWDSVWEAA